MYYNKKHEEIVNNRGDGYKYISSYKWNEETIDDKNNNGGFIRVKCPYCGAEYDVMIEGFKKGNKCGKCCQTYENSFAYYIQQELKEPLNKYWDWEKNAVNPYCITPQSGKKIYIKCTKTDYHGSYLISPHTFYNGRRCPYCVNRKIHPKDSFGQYLIDKFGKNAIEKYWSPKNTLDPFNIAPKSSIKKVWILCQEKDYHNDNGGYEISLANFYKGNRCPYCASKKVHPKDSFGQYLISVYGEDAIKKYWSNKNTTNPFSISCGSEKKVWLLCQDKEYHNDNGGYLTNLNNFKEGKRCTYCGNHKTHYRDSFGYLYPDKAKYWSYNNKKSPFEVAPMSDKKYKFICEKCGKEFERSLEHLNRNDLGVVCTNCNSSVLEKNTSKVLDKYNIEYHREYSYPNLNGVGNKLLRFDFYLPDYNLLIECQGEQHEKWQKTWTSKDKFERQLEHDRRKKEYTKQNNINLLEIWYYDIDNIEEILIKELNLG